MIAVASESTPPAPRSRKKPVARATRKPGDRPVKIGLYLSEDSARRLSVTSLMEGRDRSAIVDELIRLHLRRYSVVTRGGTDGPPEDVSTT